MTELTAGQTRLKPSLSKRSLWSSALVKGHHIQSKQHISDRHSLFKPPHLHNTHAFEKRQVPFKPPFVYRSPASSTVGKPFNVSLDIVQSLHLIPETFTILTSANVDDVVFVTAASSDHFIESMNLISSVQTFKPGHVIIYYDLGLQPTQANEVSRQ